MAMIVMVFIMIANCIVQCDGLYVQDNKMATEAILGRQSFVCLLHGLQHWLHGLAT